MAGLTDVLNIARSALITQQRALNVTGNNIANATTPGYVRQTLNEIEEDPERTAVGTIGRGVTDTGVYAERDALLDASYRNEQSTFSSSDSAQTMLNQLQTVLTQTQTTGLTVSLDNLWGSFGDLANDPASGAAKVAVQGDANQVIQQLHTLASGVDDVTSSATGQFNADITQVNAISTQLAQLNTQILAEGGPDHNAPDLENQRGLLLDQLSGIMDIKVLQRTDGSVGVIAGDTLLVDGSQSQQLQAQAQPDGSMAVNVVGSAHTVTISGGELAGLNNTLGTVIPGLKANLDQFTSALVTSVNATYSTNAGGTNFFDPAGTTAATIALAPEVAASANNIATGTTTDAGDNSIALKLADFGTTSNASLGGSSLDDFFQGIVTDVGTQTANAQQSADAAQTVSSALDAQRQSETGVSTDEELLKMIQQQQAYAAAAHLVTVANDMMQDLLQMVD